MAKTKEDLERRAIILFASQREKLVDGLIDSPKAQHSVRVPDDTDPVKPSFAAVAMDPTAIDSVVHYFTFARHVLGYHENAGGGYRVIAIKADLGTFGWTTVWTGLRRSY